MLDPQMVRSCWITCSRNSWTERDFEPGAAAASSASGSGWAWSGRRRELPGHYRSRWLKTGHPCLRATPPHLHLGIATRSGPESPERRVKMAGPSHAELGARGAPSRL